MQNQLKQSVGFKSTNSVLSEKDKITPEIYYVGIHLNEEEKGPYSEKFTVLRSEIKYNTK